MIFWIGSLIKCELLTCVHGSEFTIPDEVTSWIGNSGSTKIIGYSDQSAKIYYYYLNDYYSVEIDFIKNNSIWQYKTWRSVWSSGSADGASWPYFHHSPVGMALLCIAGIPLILLAGIVLYKDIDRKIKSKNK